MFVGNPDWVRDRIKTKAGHMESVKLDNTELDPEKH